MSAQPIYLDVEEEISELIERLRQSSSQEVSVVVPARSRIGQSRFNFRLLRDYARQYGKKISIISPEVAVQQMAAENGFNAFAGMDEYDSPAAEPALALAGVGAGAASAFAPEARQPGLPEPLPTRAPRMTMAKQVSHSSDAASGGRFLLYLGAALIVLVALISVAVLVPSATITLTAKAQPLTNTASIDAAPGAAPVKVRQLSGKKDLAHQFKSTGIKITPAIAASGAVLYTNNNCNVGGFPADVPMKAGQIVSTPGGVQFVNQAAIFVPYNKAVSVNVLANSPGAASNVPDHAISVINNYSGTCLTAANTSPTAGGADEVKQTFVSQGDLDSAKAQLEGELRGTVLDDLTKQANQSEKLADTVDYSSTFTSDHKANDAVSVFNGSASMTGNGAAYNLEDVKTALRADLVKHVPTGFALTDNPVVSDFHVSQSTADGHISFVGSSKGFVAPKLDFAKIQARLVGSNTASARLYLGTLPVESAKVQEKPFSLPLLPFLSSRIKIAYQVDTGGTAAPSQ